MGTRSTEIGRGLAHVESGVNTLISFSTQPGNVALDGTGRNSPFAGALVKHVSTSNAELSRLLIAVRNDVLQETQRKQVPWEHSALTGPFYFSAAPQVISPPSRARVGEAERTWSWIKNTTDQAVLENFLKQFADTPPGANARARIQELKKQNVAIAVPPSAVEPTEPQPDREALVRDIQKQLQRVGCDPGNIDGAWGPRSKSALSSFAKHANVPLRIEEPTPSALEEVSRRMGRIVRLFAGAMRKK